ncbi:2-iminoacetate synthase ThiH [Paenibacillus tepidiphilus]|uniref:2-iminoacetate synthase ThiH n=1 Tax=Paenibacillus tepidiphilus TaxID=2608683 RepID=UPI00123B7102|nr:2-iminoacetate synthase ThiH [Paenibacillus tepidiphilus]
MSFYNRLAGLKERSIHSKQQEYTDSHILRILGKPRLGEEDLLALLSPAAGRHLEAMAQKAQQVTRSQFGHAVQLFTPMYVSDFCVNHCEYCSFSSIYDFPRRKLDMREVELEAAAIASTGMRHVLLLTGESRQASPVSYLKACTEVLRGHFASVGIEVNPLSVSEYMELAQAGVDSLTLFQEVYDQETYRRLHIKGPKRNYRSRLDAPERGCAAGFRSVNIGALLGLYDWREEAFMAAMHADYLQNKYPGCEISLSIPRFRPFLGDYSPESEVTDSALVQTVLAYRLFLPRAGITLSSREPASLRDRLVHLGITKMSAGVSTAVGGHTAADGTPQFEISDGRSVEEIREMLYRNGLQPVFKDWDILV